MCVCRSQLLPKESKIFKCCCQVWIVCSISTLILIFKGHFVAVQSELKSYLSIERILNHFINICIKSRSRCLLLSDDFLLYITKSFFLILLLRCDCFLHCVSNLSEFTLVFFWSDEFVFLCLSFYIYMVDLKGRE